MSALRIATGLTADEFAAPRASLLPSTSPSGEPIGRAQPCRAGMGAMRQAAGADSHGAGGDAAAPGVLAGVRGRRFSRTTRMPAN
jgi:hypothetical protein